MTEDCTKQDMVDMQDCLETLRTLAKKRWGIEHVLEKAGYEKIRCTKCGILFLSWSKEKLIETECVSWEDKLKKMI